MEHLLGAAVSGIIFFAAVLISVLLIFNTGLKLPNFVGMREAFKSDGSDVEEAEELGPRDYGTSGRPNR
jgi:hypothetical protein